MSTQTAKSMHPDVGKVGELHAEEYTLQVTVNIVDAREVWHRLQYLIEPVAGSGQKWVDAARVERLRPSNFGGQS